MSFCWWTTFFFNCLVPSCNRIYHSVRWCMFFCWLPQTSHEKVSFFWTKTWYYAKADTVILDAFIWVQQFLLQGSSKVHTGGISVCFISKPQSLAAAVTKTSKNRSVRRFRYPSRVSLHSKSLLLCPVWRHIQDLTMTVENNPDVPLRSKRSFAWYRQMRHYDSYCDDLDHPILNRSSKTVTFSRRSWIPRFLRLISSTSSRPLRGQAISRRLHVSSFRLVPNWTPLAADKSILE